MSKNLQRILAGTALPLVLLISACQQEPDLKARAAEFIKAVNNQDVETVEKLVHSDYIQHNPFVPTGRDGFVNLFPILKKYNTRAETVRMFQDGNYVVLHNIWKNAEPFGAPIMVAFDVIRFDKDGLIAEHWDAMMINTSPNPAGRSLTDGPTEILEGHPTDEYKAKVASLFDSLISGNPEEAGNAFQENFQKDYHQHNPVAGDGIQGFLAARKSGDLVFEFKKQHKVLGEGNFVLSISEGTHRGKPAVFYDLLRFENGTIAEHWDVIQDIPSENLANDNTMFGFQ
ncbi:MAG: nuclear transport factor 2 family protein [Leptospiraceae bacterium]|nr:nuclear transport factor 2 family protein [Leptospiraceae bacterium]